MKLAELDEVTKKLKCSDATVRSAQAYFDTVLEDYPDLSERFDSDARIMQHPFFESGTLTVQDGHEEALTTVDKS